MTQNPSVYTKKPDHLEKMYLVGYETKNKICFQMTDSLNWWKCTGNERSKILFVILDLKTTFGTATYVKVEKSQLNKHPVEMPSPPHYITQL